jgi:hypothetical protein
MIRYYSSNALYERLEAVGCQQFCWAVGNSWVLLYGDSKGVPRLVICASGTSTVQLDDLGREKIQVTHALAKELAGRANLPFGTIEFDDRVPEISNVSLNGTLVSLNDLKRWFSGIGIAVRDDISSAPLKALNDTSSSAYHNWQRSALGHIVVTDIDLFRLNTNSRMAMTLYELKRSFIPLDRWAPYRADYSNFNLASAFAEMSDVEFHIVYNVRHKTPRVFDDVSRLRLFSYSFQAGAKLLTELAFDDFVQGAPRA